MKHKKWNVFIWVTAHYTVMMCPKTIAVENHCITHQLLSKNPMFFIDISFAAFLFLHHSIKMSPIQNSESIQFSHHEPTRPQFFSLFGLKSAWGGVGRWHTSPPVVSEESLLLPSRSSLELVPFSFLSAQRDSTRDASGLRALLSLL